VGTAEGSAVYWGHRRKTLELQSGQSSWRCLCRSLWSGRDPGVVSSSLEVNERRDEGSRTHQRPHLEELVVPCRPVVQQHEAEDVLLCIFDRHVLTPGNGFGDEIAHFELEVEAACWTVDGFRV
jgi:hypothetical protein